MKEQKDTSIKKVSSTLLLQFYRQFRFYTFRNGKIVMHVGIDEFVATLLSSLLFFMTPSFLRYER